MSTTLLRRLLYALFALSGFAGLIYESIWSHYLKLFLGHAAYAQTLVLVIFMGGMALGAFLAGEWSRRLRYPLAAYVAVELVLGVAALVFDGLFRGMQVWVFDSVIPALGSPLAVDLAKWTLSALIILPQSVLLGATFPLMSAGLVRLEPAIAGRTLGWLYFTNSLGAAAGVLASGFVLIDWVGLPGTILTAGLINFMLAGAVWTALRRSGFEQQPEASAPTATAGAPWLMLGAAFLTGAASFLYEIGWIRMLSLVLGSSTHSFELMLSAFILGLALGAFFIRSRIDRNTNPLQLLGWIQVVMGLLALLSLPFYLQMFDAMAGFLGIVQRSEGAYVIFNLYAHLLCLLLMLPVTFCAGMTLPLITAVLIRAGHGEAGIGRVYAANTLGAITGVIVAVHVVMPLLGLREVVVAGALVDMGLGLYLLFRAAAPWPRIHRLALGASLVSAAIVVAGVHFDPRLTASGVFRHGQARAKGEILFHRDGKTATVDVLHNDGMLKISTNGKVDAALDPGAEKASLDDYTMILAGVLPLLYKPDAQDVAVIGMGSGRTSHTFLSYAGIRSVDTVEIEPAMVEGARHFAGANDRVFADPRSRIVIDDAKTFFARNGKRYDVIISEPSNPWVSGVASLFSVEFYRQVQRYMNEGGVFLQWLQLYEIDPLLVATVVRALGEAFGDYALYASTSSDMLIVATPGRLPALSDQALADAGLQALSIHANVAGTSDAVARRVGTRRSLAPFFGGFGAPANSDYFPVLDQGAAQRRFMSRNATSIHELHMVTSRIDAAEPGLLTPTRFFPPAEMAVHAQRVAGYWRNPAAGRENLDASAVRALDTLRALDRDCEPDLWNAAWSAELDSMIAHTVPYWSATDTRDFVKSFKAKRCFGRAAEAVRLRLDLLEAAGLRDWPALVRRADALLSHDTTPAPRPAYLLRELMLAEYMAGGRAALARRLGQEAPLEDSVITRYFRWLAFSTGGETE